jgi:hypothetical protein
MVTTKSPLIRNISTPSPPFSLHRGLGNILWHPAILLILQFPHSGRGSEKDIPQGFYKNSLIAASVLEIFYC